MKGKTVALFVMILLATAAGCRALDDGRPPEDVSFQLKIPFTVANGQSGVLQQGDLRITFDSVVRDGRCPSEVNCAEQGAVEILVVTEGADGERERYEMNPDPALAEFGWAPTTVTFAKYVIELQAVQPYPRRPEDLEELDGYEATFIVSE